MSRIYSVIIFLSILVFVLSQSCGKNRKPKPAGTNKSHHTGSDCMSCHHENNDSTIAFSFAGTVLDEERKLLQPDAEIQLYTEHTGGELVATIYTDLLGNFYTTKKIDFSKGLYARLAGPAYIKKETGQNVRKLKRMKDRVYTGSCNSCHSLGVEKLGI